VGDRLEEAVTSPSTRSSGRCDDFRRLLKVAGEHGLSIALDIAFQCSPDTPTRKSIQSVSPFVPTDRSSTRRTRRRVRGHLSVRFECEAWPELWAELLSIVEFWIEAGL